MTDLSIVIVSYNSAKTISHCLESIKSSSIDQESLNIVIVDNNSKDHTVALINDYYPDVTVIINDDNVGFAKACNIGAKSSESSYLLFLNPDTVLDYKALEFLLSYANTQDGKVVLGGALYDGRNNYLQESARSLPTLSSSLLRISRLDRLFKNWSYYIPYDGVGPISVGAITGALFWVERVLFDYLGGFDEQFFLYGEDLDICLRLGKLDIPIQVVPTVKAIHFKGESGARSWNRNFHFYDALRIYAEKHFALNILSKYILMLVTYGLSLLVAFSHSVLPKILDIFKCLLILSSTSLIWSWGYHHDISYFDWYQVIPLLTALSALFVMVLVFSGHYRLSRNRINSSTSFISYFIAASSMIMMYAFLPEHLRFSRSAILIGVAISLIVFINMSLRKNKSFSRFYKPASGLIKDAIDKIFPNAIFTEDIAHSVYSLSCSPLNVTKLQSSQRASHVLYYNPKLDAFFNSDLSFQTGDTFDQYSMFMYLDPQSIFRRRMVAIGFGLFSSIILLPVIIMSNERSSITTNIVGLLNGNLGIIAEPERSIPVSGRPEIGEGLISLSECEPNKELSALCYEYTLHYSISKDLYYCITKFRTLLKKLCNDIEN